MCNQIKQGLTYVREMCNQIKQDPTYVRDMCNQIKQGLTYVREMCNQIKQDLIYVREICSQINLICSFYFQLYFFLLQNRQCTSYLVGFLCYPLIGIHSYIYRRSLAYAKYTC